MGRQHGFRLRGHNDVRVQIPLSPPEQIKYKLHKTKIAYQFYLN